MYGRVFSSGAWVGVFGCGVPLMNKPQGLLMQLGLSGRGFIVNKRLIFSAIVVFSGGGYYMLV